MRPSDWEKVSILVGDQVIEIILEKYFLRGLFRTSLFVEGWITDL